MSSTRGVVVQHPNVRAHQAGHETVTRIALAKRLAALHQYDFSDCYDGALHTGCPVYFVPDDTLTAAQARRVGIACERDLFGGVVPHPFVATKAITHPLVDAQARAPKGWSHGLARRMAPSVLPGYSAFSAEDARRCVACLLEFGPVRVKPTWGIGGNGQSKIDDAAQFESLLPTLDQTQLRRLGVVIEQHLEQVTTYSVGQVQTADMQIAYCGTQRLTPNNRGQRVYGGSSLFVTRGDFAALARQRLPERMLQAVTHARRYDEAIASEFPGLLASRRNYDVIRGEDARGAWREGVLEQSWRIGGASPAEVAAFEAFKADPNIDVVRASCVEAYGAHAPPARSVVYFDGVDPEVGRITKYSFIEPNEDPA